MQPHYIERNRHGVPFRKVAVGSVLVALDMAPNNAPEVARALGLPFPIPLADLDRYVRFDWSPHMIEWDIGQGLTWASQDDLALCGVEGYNHEEVD